MHRFIEVAEEYYIAVDNILSVSRQTTMIVIETLHSEEPTVLYYEDNQECQNALITLMKVLR
jgi:hypothetical protein